jgi:hypothetical protein
MSLYIYIYISHIMEYYSAIKKNEFLFFKDKWIKLKNIMLNEVSQIQKDTGCVFSLIYER